MVVIIPSAIAQRIAACAVLLAILSRGAQGPALLLYGGDGNKTFLGCLNCSQYETNSVMSKYGPYGSRYSSTSIFNHYSDYGSKYSDYSACNPYAAHAPVIVDKDGAFYGRLTVNESAPDRVRSGETRGWLTAVCADS